MSDGAITIPLGLVRRIVLVGVVILGAAVVAGVVWQQRDALVGSFARGLPPEIDRSAYQAVFLSGGQVFFGRLSGRGDEVYVLSDVYYLSDPREGNPRGQLVKRGSELHGPRDPMIIPADQVLLIENLRDDSEVVQAIKRNKAGEPLATLAPPLSTPRPTGTR